MFFKVSRTTRLFFAVYWIKHLDISRKKPNLQNRIDPDLETIKKRVKALKTKVSIGGYHTYRIAGLRFLKLNKTNTKVNKNISEFYIVNMLI